LQVSLGLAWFCGSLKGQFLTQLAGEEQQEQFGAWDYVRE